MTSLKHINYLRQCVKQYNFSTPEMYRIKTPQWLRRHYNGIGAEWMPAWVRKKITNFVKYLEPVALVHDVDFLNPDKSFLNFTIANARSFYNACKSGHVFQGAVFALACQCFGWSAWKEGKENMMWYYYYKEEKGK